MTENERLHILDALKRPRPDQLRMRIILRAKKVLRECDETIHDIESWNKANPQHVPFDAGYFLVARHQAQKTLREFGVEV